MKKISSRAWTRKTERRGKRRDNAVRPRPRPSAFATDIRRTITGNLKRFISLFVITALGTTMFVGLKAACDDLRFTADGHYDDQRLYDISVQSTLGLDEDDIEALNELDGVDVAEGGYTETAYTEVEDASEKVDLRALSAEGLNEPLLVSGRLPRDDNEVAVTQKYLDASGKSIGDTVTFEGADDEGADAKGADAGDTDADGSADDGAADAEGVSDSVASSSAIFARGEYTIVGSVLDPMDVNAGTGAMSFRASPGAQYVFFFTPGAVADRSTYTVAYVTVAGAADLLCYSDEYEELIDEVKQQVEDIRAEREEARTGSVKDDAAAQIDEAEADAAAQLADAESQLDDAQAQIDDALAQIAAGEQELANQGALAESQLAAAEQQLTTAKAQLDAAQAIIDAKQAELDAGRVQAQDALTQIAQAEAAAATLKSQMGDAWPADAWNRLLAGDSSAEGAFTSAVTAYAEDAAAQLDQIVSLCQQVEDLLGKLAQVGEGDDATALREQTLQALDELADRLAQVPALGDYADQIEQARRTVATMVETLDPATLNELKASVASMRAGLESQRTQLDGLPTQAGQLAQAALGKKAAQDALRQIEAGQKTLTASRDEVQRNYGRIESGLEQLQSQRASAAEQLAAGAQELADGKAEAAAGQSELDEGRAEFEEQKAAAEARFADARSALDDIDRATWYIQDRSSLSSYSSIESDASSIESIATVFPIIFFTVAVLISSTTVTRMVEEDRGLIGVYKALGYSRRRILSKYLIYAFSACIAGGIAGDIFGFIVLPEVIFTIFDDMYSLPAFVLSFNPLSSVTGVALFALGIVGATFYSCRAALRETPASLMRPKAPKAGKRILLEHITPIWHRLGFLNKVSARNLFRYKKRAFMTVFGIAGCTGLLICGLGIRDTVVSLKPRQYGDEGIVRYDLMAVCADADFEQGRAELAASDQVDQLLEARVDSVTAEYDGAKESVQIVVVPRGADLSAYMKTENEAGETLELPEDGAGALITKNAEQVLGFSVGDELTLQDSSFNTGTVRVDGITVNYLGNFVFLTEDAYREAFGEKVTPNGFLVNLTGTDDEKIAYADELAAGDTFVTVSSSTKIANEFSQAFQIIDVVVYVVTVMAGALAFAVVFTLSNTNISERERELATIKVLGFRRREVHVYINKETIILTVVGIIAGFPVGYGITRFLTFVLRMPSIYFDTVVDLPSYLIAAAMSMAFTLIINQFTNRSLDRIDMVGALKSAE